MNIAAERIDTLARLGYTSGEARFIYIVATHSGYFTHRQFRDFAGITAGKHSHGFLTKLLREKHASYHTYRGGARVYHIFARKVFRAIDRDDLRTRRRHQLDYIKTRLVALDFVLANLDCEYLETEAEKVPFFESHLNVSRSLLPRRTYTSKVSSGTTIRYFVDRFPLFLRGSSLCFTYVDASSLTLQSFVTHLHAYRSLLRSVPEFEFIYVAPSSRFFRAAQLEFSRRVLASNGTVSRELLLRYFGVRKQWEAGQRVSAADVVFLNTTKPQLRDPSVEMQYTQWARGTLTEAEIHVPSGTAEFHNRGIFVTQKCGTSLSVFQRLDDELGERQNDPTTPALSPRHSPDGVTP
jgi:hypothetical protein